MSEEQEIRDAVDSAKSRGTFNIISVLQDRAYPKTEIKIILDEATIYEISVIKDAMGAIDSKVGKGGATEAQRVELEELELKYEELSKKLMGSRYTVNLRGITEGKREELFREVLKKYPVQYESSTDISNILANGRSEKPSPERDALFTDYLWREQIESIVNPDGDEQSEFSYTDIKAMRNSFPLSAIMKINEAIDKLRASTALFIMETGEDFLAKP